MPFKSDDFPKKRALLEAIARCIQNDAHIDCACNFVDAQYQGYYISIVAHGYGKGRPKNLLSLYLEQPLICAYIPRIKELGEFEKRYGFRAEEIRPDNTTNTEGLPYHSVTISTEYFDPLVSDQDTALIRRFLIRSTRDSLAMRGLSMSGLEKLQQTDPLVHVPALPVSNTHVPQAKRAPSADPHPAFTKVLVEAYNIAKRDTHYKSPLYLQMLSTRYGYDTAIQLICTSKPANGFTYLWEHKRLDLTVEAYVLRPEWSPIFSEDILRAAHQRLAKYEYQFPSNLWKPSQRVLPTLPSPPTSEASDLNEGPADRVKSTTYRILRDTEKALRVKALYDYRCQICGHRITLPNGTYYAEAHHIQPLGEDGPDSERNIICVCPNHHAELDYRAIPLDLSKLRTVSGHSIDPKFVDYHNRVLLTQR